MIHARASLGLVALAAVAFGCQGPAADGPAPAAPLRAPLDAGVPAPTVFSYVDDHGRIHMAASPDAVPARYRDQVVATDTGLERRARLQSDRVMVLDLRASEQGKPLNYSVVDLSKRLGPRPRTLGPADDPGRLGSRLVRRAAARVSRLLGLAPAVEPARVILYSAPWCGFCKKAAAYLRGRGVPFEQRDIEASQAAAEELSAKLQRAGLRGGGIPVLDIDGTIVIGFDRARIESLIDR